MAQCIALRLPTRPASGPGVWLGVPLENWLEYTNHRDEADVLFLEKKLTRRGSATYTCRLRQYAVFIHLIISTYFPNACYAITDPLVTVVFVLHVEG